MPKENPENPKKNNNFTPEWIEEPPKPGSFRLYQMIDKNKNQK